jgi:hypothetical protein
MICKKLTSPNYSKQMAYGQIRPVKGARGDFTNLKERNPGWPVFFASVSILPSDT